ncbi:MAG: hypothetical protein ACPGWR_01205 [Ardenticatenaceae bacterium]
MNQQQKWLIPIGLGMVSTIMCVCLLGFIVFTFAVVPSESSQIEGVTEIEVVREVEVPVTSTATTFLKVEPSKTPTAKAAPPTTAPSSPTPTSDGEGGGGALADPVEPDTSEPEQGTSEPESGALQTLNALQSAFIPIRDLYEIGISFGKISASEPRVASEVDPGYQIGDTLVFNVSNSNTDENFETEATLRAQTAHASWWVDNNVEINQEDLDASARVFEEKTYPTNRAIFGSEWTPGVDGDPRVHVFVGNVPGVGGYYSSADEFPRSIDPFSNEKEIFYINSSNALPGDDYFDGILAHEFQHMIHWNMDRNEDVWMNEGLSELAADVNDLYVGSGAYSFAEQPDLPVTRWSDQTHPFYGSAYLFIYYFYQRFGEDAVSQLVQTEANSIEGFNQVLAPYGITFNELFADWTVTNLLDDTTVEDGRFGYAKSVAYTPAFAHTSNQYPEERQADVNQYGTDYIRFEASNDQSPLRIEFSGNKTNRVVPTEPYSGQWMLWSNRGDDTHSSTTRAFDLSALDSATLRFWAWYDIEKDYDYAYVTVSTDGGSHWQPLATADTTDTNPQGNSFGNAFTNKSGHPASAPEDSESYWQEQVVDLTPFVGQPILISFHQITDDALNYNGMVIDDISIPELNYFEDFEQGDGGWEHAGFVRIDNILPQYFIVRAVAEGSNGTRIFDFPLNENNYGTLTIDDFGNGSDQVTLIVTGAMRFTAEQATYSYSARIGQ